MSFDIDFASSLFEVAPDVPVGTMCSEPSRGPSSLVAEAAPRCSTDDEEEVEDQEVLDDDDPLAIESDEFDEDDFDDDFDDDFEEESEDADDAPDEKLPSG